MQQIVFTDPYEIPLTSGQSKTKEKNPKKIIILSVTLLSQ